MELGESIDSYYGRQCDIILRLPQNHVITEEEKMRMFMKGLTPTRLRASVKEVAPTTLNAASTRARFLE